MKKEKRIKSQIVVNDFNGTDIRDVIVMLEQYEKDNFECSSITLKIGDNQIWADLYVE